MLRQCASAAVGSSDDVSPGDSVRRRIAAAADGVGRAPERLIGDEKMKRAKAQNVLLGQWLMNTPTSTIVLYCSLPLMCLIPLSLLYNFFPKVGTAVEFLMRTVVSAASLITAAQLLSARQAAAPAQQRDEQLWLAGCMVLFAVRFEPITWLFHGAWLLGFWPPAFVRRTVAQLSVYAVMGFATLMLDRLSRRGEASQTRLGAEQMLHVKLLAIAWACSEWYTNTWINVVAPSIFNGIALFVGCCCCCVWFGMTAWVGMRAVVRMPWRDAAAKGERLFLSFLIALCTMLFVTQLLFREAKFNLPNKIAGFLALEFLFLLTHLFWPSNLSQAGDTALDLGV